MGQINALMDAMTAYMAGDPRRIQHFTKVWAYAHFIGQAEGLDDATQFPLEAAALTHDIGVGNSERKYGDNNGQTQQEEGPPPAREMLTGLGFDAAVIDRVCYLIAHHHTYTNMDGLDYQILVEADFLVNLYEMGNTPTEHLRETIFRTAAGRRLLDTMYQPERNL